MRVSNRTPHGIFLVAIDICFVDEFQSGRSRGREIVRGDRAREDDGQMRDRKEHQWRHCGNSGGQ